MWSAGALAGAGGATAYMNGFDFSAMARSLLMGPPHQSLPWQAQIGNKGEMDALYRLVRSSNTIQLTLLCKGKLEVRKPSYPC